MRKLLYPFLCLLMTIPAANVLAQCNAGFGWQANPTGNNLLNVDFTNNSTAGSNPSGNAYTNCSIDYGDGSLQQGFGSVVSHNYANAGSYSVTVIISTYDSTSSGGWANICSDTATAVVTVNSSPCASTVAMQENGAGAGSFTFTATSSMAGLNYTWDFGDGTTGTGNPATHIYTSPGNYTISLTGSGSGCTSTNTGNTVNVNIFPACSTLQAAFSTSANSGLGTLLYFNNQSTVVPGLTNCPDWYFGDGSSQLYAPWSNSNYASHIYSSAGTYTVTMVNRWMTDTTSGTGVYCIDTVIQTVTAADLNYISGDIITDSVGSNLSYKVWLIVHDTAANTLTAVDSVETNVWVSYQFNNKPAGDYLVKAMALGQTPGTTGMLPTYHNASVYWSSANHIIHAGGTTSGKSIHMQSGIVTSGPGFVGGNISAGAGKGTGTGVAGMLVFIRNGSNQLITSAVTNADGDFSFSNLPVGTYSVYPEAINYTTTPYNTIQVTSGQANVSGIDFVRTSTEIKPKQTTGIATVSEKDGLKIYPNPARNMATIENQQNLFSHVKIMNAVGQLVSETNLKSGINKVDISVLNTGIYYLLISGDKGSRSMKFVKE